MEARNLNTIDWRVGRQTAPRVDTAPVRQALREALATLRLWWRRARQRAELRRITSRDARFFQDIGVSRASLTHESNKWFWQA